MKLNKLINEKLENELDFDYRLDKNRIETVEDFEKNIIAPYKQGKKIFFRGERKDDLSRPLLPSVFRNKDDLLENGKKVNHINAEFLRYYYSKFGSFIEMYEKTVAKVDVNKMYPFLAFSQHYLGISPLIDFSKNPFASLSFALKDRKEYDEDALFYTIEIKDERDYTNSVDVANYWLRNYSVFVFSNSINGNFESFNNAVAEYKALTKSTRGKSSLFDMNTPRAKLIDVPTNDLMVYQQGVFLLLDDFSLMGKAYLTKKIRDEFTVKKWLINKEICPELYDMLIEENPYYAFKYITNLNLIAERVKNKS